MDKARVSALEETVSALNVETREKNVEHIKMTKDPQHALKQQEIWAKKEQDMIRTIQGMAHACSNRLQC